MEQKRGLFVLLGGCRDACEVQRPETRLTGEVTQQVT